MAVGAIALSAVTIAIDKEFLHQKNVQQWWLYGGGPDSAQSVLSVVIYLRFCRRYMTNDLE